MKSEILKALRGRDGYVSGQELCGLFGVTRSAIWKGIRQLKEEGYEIEAVPNKGYRLLVCPDTVSEAELESRMETEWAGRKVISLEAVDSTNNYAKNVAEQGAAHGTLVVTEEQNGGKGRRGRGWVMPRGTSVAMSIVLRPEIAPQHASMLTLAAGAAVAWAIREVTGLEAGIKWPNDVVVNGKKICGILTELSMEMERIHYVVIGMGINTNITAFPEELRETATSLQLELGRPMNRAELICAVMKKFEKSYEKFIETQDMTLLMEDYQKLLVNIGRQVRVLEPGNEYTGTAKGIDRLGQLLVQREDGTVTAVYAGEVSVRGIYHYV
ncbi:MAG: biotin--[acetyl-CoA-carboxylase] ligase [Eubacteriales bacterium]|nr:biotin--[acetyl-CoA-carboxylase] ligase [Eubacteriales bacterium]